MSEPLTQSEIDELLQSLMGGAAADPSALPPQRTGKRRVREYDFKSPKKLAKDELKILRAVHENLARHLASYFSGILRTYCEISVVSIEEQPYFEYNNVLPDSILVGVMGDEEGGGSVLVDIANVITFALIERLMGGAGESNMPEREFTEIEILLAEKTFHQIAHYIGVAWSGIQSFNLSLKNIETNARFIRSMPMDEVVAIIVMEAAIGSARGNITICIPCINLEGIISKADYNKQFAQRGVEPGQREAARLTLTEKIKEVSVEISAVLGETTLSLKEVLNLQVGDVIRLDRTADQDVRIMLGGKQWFRGIPGVKRSNKAIKVSKVV